MRFGYFSRVCVLLTMMPLLPLKAAEFKHSVNRLSAPVLVADVLRLPADSPVAELAWPEHLHGWVSQQDITQWLAKEGNEKQLGDWQGSRKAWVEWCYEMDFDHINAGIEAAHKIAGELENVQVNDIRFAKQAMPCFSHKIVNVAWSDFSIRNHESATIRGEFLLANGTKKMTQIDFEARVLASVFVLQEAATKQTAWSALELVQTLHPWRANQVFPSAKFSSYRLTKSLRKGQVISFGDLELIPDVSAGEEVKVQVKHGSITISTKAKVMTSGNVGDMVKVKIENSGTLSDAIVLAKGVVNVAV